jgi:hypothetical protein
MFDIFGVFDWEHRERTAIANPFTAMPEYAGVPHDATSVQCSAGAVHFLSRKGEPPGYCSDGAQRLFLFGYAFTNLRHRAAGGEAPHVADVREIMGLVAELGDRVVERLKGSFVLVLVDQAKREVRLLSDRFNVYPVYYTCKNGQLAFSSSVPALQVTGCASGEVNRQTVVEYALFDYCLGDRTFFADVKLLDMASSLTFSPSGLSLRRYSSIESLFSSELLPRDESLDLLVDLLHENVNLHVGDAKRFVISVTGGFDGRCNLALLDRNPGDFLVYSFGMPGSKQITIPQQIARTLGLRYEPILLGQSFAESYTDWAERAVFFSNGNASIWRANYLYAFQRLASFSAVSLTGIFGSEILRPIRNLGIQINDNSEAMLLEDDFDAAFDRRFALTKTRGCYEPALFDEQYTAIKESFRADFIDRYAGIGKLIRFFFFFLHEGVRKYFMEEIQAVRVFTSERHPFFDHDLLDLIYRTRWAGLYSGAMKRSALKRRRAQMLYAHAFRKYWPELGGFVTDRGYRPDDLLSPFYGLKILPGYLRAKRYQRAKGDDTFDITTWTRKFLEENRSVLTRANELVRGDLDGNLRAGKNETDSLSLSKAYSLKFFLSRFL